MLHGVSKIDGMIDVTGRGGGRRRQSLDDLKENTGYWNLIGGRTTTSSVENAP